MRLHTLDKATAQAADVVHALKPDQLHAPTPCREWNVRALTNHLLQVACALRLAGLREPVPGDLWNRDLMAQEWAELFDKETSAALAAWADPAAWEGEVSLNGMDMPASMAADMFLSDLAIHGWDLAQATAHPYQCDYDVAQVAHSFLAATADQGRQIGIFAPPPPTADDAPLFDRALALSGRDPHWTRLAT